MHIFLSIFFPLWINAFSLPFNDSPNKLKNQQLHGGENALLNEAHYGPLSQQFTFNLEEDHDSKSTAMPTTRTTKKGTLPGAITKLPTKPTNVKVILDDDDATTTTEDQETQPTTEGTTTTSGSGPETQPTEGTTTTAGSGPETQPTEGTTTTTGSSSTESVPPSKPTTTTTPEHPAPTTKTTATSTHPPTTTHRPNSASKLGCSLVLPILILTHYI